MTTPERQAHLDRVSAARLRRQAQDERDKAARASPHARRGHQRWADTFEASAARLDKGTLS